MKDYLSYNYCEGTVVNQRDDKTLIHVSSPAGSTFFDTINTTMELNLTLFKSQ